MNEQEFNKKVANLIARHRSRARMTRIELSTRIGVSPYQVKKYENGINCVPLYRLYLYALAIEKPFSEIASEIERKVSHEN